MKLPIPKGRRAILVLGVPLGLAAAGAFAFMQMSGGAPAPIPDPSPGQHGPMLALESRVVNLQTGTTPGGYKYAKIAVTVEIRPADAGFYSLSGEGRAKAETDEIGKHSEAVPLLQDALGQIVSSHDSASLTGADGRTKLKTELLGAMRRILGEREVLDVYFTDLVMQ